MRRSTISPPPPVLRREPFTLLRPKRDIYFAVLKFGIEQMY